MIHIEFRSGDIQGKKDPDQYKSVQDWSRQCFNAPSYNERVEVAVNELLGGFGAEAIPFEGSWPEISYINMGDTYDLTVVFDYSEEKIYATDWGTIVEEKGL